MIKNVALSLTLALAMPFLSLAQDAKSYTVSGYIKDGDSGEALINASVYSEELKSGTVSNLYGFYSFTVTEGSHTLRFSYLGYEDYEVDILSEKDLRMDIELKESENVLSEVTIVAEEKDANVHSTQMSNIKVNMATVKKMPALFGEVDIIKAIQLLPGVKTVGEGTSGFYVRGGNVDQNLVLLDEAPIYNASHLLGFFSSFNPDAIKDMELYKGAISSRYGGRLSSVLDIRMKEGDSKKFGGSAGIGTMMSRLSLEAPLSDKGSFIISGRRSYLDILAKLARPSSNNDNQFYFYDLNLKGNYTLNDNNRLMASGYFGRDVIRVDDFGVEWGNRTATLRWNHIFSPKLFSNFTIYKSDYDYFLKVTDSEVDLQWSSRLEEWSAKADFTYYFNPDHTLQFGGQAIRHILEPGTIKSFDNDTLSSEFIIDKTESIENAAYVSSDFKMNDALTLNTGLRVSSLHNVGPQSHVNYTNDFEVVDTSKFDNGIYHSYYNLEPRIGLKYSFGSQSLKLSYNRTAQYIQLASNGNASTPFDIWFTSSPNVRPQLADQYTIGYHRNFLNNEIEFSVETYYKHFANAIDFKERARLLLNKNLEGELRSGVGRAYGVEFLVKKNKGKLTGWVGYTYSKAEKKIESINQGDWFNAKYDKPHDFTTVVSYAINDRISISSNFTYSTGGAVTFPTGRYIFQGTVVPVYSERNSERLPDYHRMDVSMTLKSKKKWLNIFDSEWVFGIYNVYNRKNAFSIGFKQEENSSATFAEKNAVFSIVPSITYNAKF